MSIAEEVYRLTTSFPKDEVYGMTSQIRRAAVSIAANIAEGHGRENSGSFCSVSANVTRVVEGTGDSSDAGNSGEFGEDAKSGTALAQVRRTWPDVALFDPIDPTQTIPMTVLELDYSLFAIRYSLLTGRRG